jgi:hypothetical protein
MLRHAYASLQIERGVTPKRLQRLMRGPVLTLAIACKTARTKSVYRRRAVVMPSSEALCKGRESAEILEKL